MPWLSSCFTACHESWQAADGLDAATLRPSKEAYNWEIHGSQACTNATRLLQLSITQLTADHRSRRRSERRESRFNVRLEVLGTIKAVGLLACSCRATAGTGNLDFVYTNHPSRPPGSFFTDLAKPLRPKVTGPAMCCKEETRFRHL